MESSRKIFATIVAAGILGVGSVALAQSGPGGCDGRMGMMRGGMQRVNFDPVARADQRLAQFKSDLKLTTAQEPLWLAFSEKVKSEVDKGFQAMNERSRDLSLSAPERMTQRIEAMKQRVAAMESVNGSFKTLYDALTIEQRRVADIHAARMGERGAMGHRGHRGRMGPAGDMPPPVKG